MTIFWLLKGKLAKSKKCEFRPYLQKKIEFSQVYPLKSIIMYLTPTLTHLKVTSDQIDLEIQEFSVARSESKNVKIRTMIINSRSKNLCCNNTITHPPSIPFDNNKIIVASLLSSYILWTIM